MAIGDAIALKFTIDADGSPAKRELASVRSAVASEVKGIANSFASGVPVIGGFTSSLGAAGIGIAAVTGGALALAGGIFSLTKQASDAGSVLFDLSKKTSIQGETLSALKFAAEQSGSSIEQFSQSLVIMQKNQAAAQGGSKELQKAFKELGVDINAEPQEALKQFLARFHDLDKASVKTSDILKVFGRSGADLISTFDTLGGNLDEFIATAKRLGVTLTNEDIKAADDFGDTLGLLGTQALGLGNKFALQLAPAISRAMASASDAFTSHGQVVSIVVGGIVGSIKTYLDQLDSLLVQVNNLANLARMTSTMGLAGGLLSMYGAERGREGAKIQASVLGDVANLEAMAMRFGRKSAPTGGGGGGRGRGGGGGGRNEAQQLELRNNALFNKELEAVTRQHREILEREYNLGIKDLEEYVAESLKQNEDHYAQQLRSFDKQEEIARKHTKSQAELNQKLKDIAFERRSAEDERDKEAQRIADEAARTRSERQLALERQLADTQESVRAGLLAKAEAQREDGLIAQSQFEERRRDLEQAAFRDRQILLEAELKAFGITEERKTEINNALIKLDIDRANAAEEASRRIIAATRAEQEALDLAAQTGQAERGRELLNGGFEGGGAGGELPDFEEHKTIIGVFKDFATGAFSSVAQGFGGMIQAFLGGGAATSKGIGSMVKAITAGLAAQALVEAAMQGAHAIKEYALASASLAVWDFHGAALHLAAAKGHIAAVIAYGAVGGVAAGISLALPGGGGGGAGAMASGRNNSSPYDNASDYENRRNTRVGDPNDRTIREDRSQVITFVHVLKDNADRVIDIVTNDYRSAGRTRNVVRADFGLEPA